MRSRRFHIPQGRVQLSCSLSRRLLTPFLIDICSLFSPFACLRPHQLQAGASVAVLARNDSKFDELLPTLEEKKLPVDKTHFIAIDLASTDDVRRAAIGANEWAGGCADILVNNGMSRRASTIENRATR